MKKLFRRKKYLVNKKFQTQFTLFFIFEAIAVLILTLVFMYHIHQKYYAYIYKLEYDNRVYALLINSFVGTDLTSEEIDAPVQRKILLELLTFAVILFSMILIPSIIASHRIAGPLYKLHKTMKDITRGTYNQKLAFRKRDSFREIESTFNDMVTSLNYKKSSDLQDIDNVIQKIIFIIKKNQANNEIKLDAHAIRDILLRMKKRKLYNE